MGCCDSKARKDNKVKQQPSNTIDETSTNGEVDDKNKAKLNNSIGNYKSLSRKPSESVSSSMREILKKAIQADSYEEEYHTSILAEVQTPRTHNR